MNLSQECACLHLMNLLSRAAEIQGSGKKLVIDLGIHSWLNAWARPYNDTFLINIWYIGPMSCSSHSVMSGGDPWFLCKYSSWADDLTHISNSTTCYTYYKSCFKRTCPQCYMFQIYLMIKMNHPARCHFLIAIMHSGCIEYVCLLVWSHMVNAWLYPLILLTKQSTFANNNWLFNNVYASSVIIWICCLPD